jgi:hypothetical protein
VSLIGVKEADLKHLLTTQLGWPPGHEDMLRIAARLGSEQRKWAKLYRFNALHFSQALIHFTKETVSLKGRAENGELLPISADVPAAEVLARTRLVLAGQTLRDALDVQLDLPAERAARVLPQTRVEERALAEFERLGLGEDKARKVGAPHGAAIKRSVDMLRTPTKPAAGGDSVDGKPGRSPPPKVANVAGRLRELNFQDATLSAQKVLARTFRAQLASRKLVVLQQQRAECESKLVLAELRAVEGDAAALGLRDHLEAPCREAYAAALVRLVATEREVCDLEDKLRVSERVGAALRRAASEKAKFATWHTRMLDDPQQLGKVVRELTGFRTARDFRLAFDQVFDRQGCPACPLGPGVTSRLDYYFSPKHNPSSKATSSGSRNGLNPKNPAGLDGPIEACFLTYVMLRCGLLSDVVAVLFGISAGAASQIFATWVPFISMSLQAWSPWPTRERVLATLPNKFREGPLASTTASARCRIIIDCTEIWVQTPSDPAIRQLF